MFQNDEEYEANVLNRIMWIKTMLAIESITIESITIDDRFDRCNVILITLDRAERSRA